MVRGESDNKTDVLDLLLAPARRNTQSVVGARPSGFGTQRRPGGVRPVSEGSRTNEGKGTNLRRWRATMDLWEAWQRVEYIRTLSSRARVRTGHDLAEAERMFVLAMLWVLPHSTEGDLTELRYLSGPRIERLLAQVVTDGYVGSALMGHLHGEKNPPFPVARWGEAGSGVLGCTRGVAGAGRHPQGSSWLPSHSGGGERRDPQVVWNPSGSDANCSGGGPQGRAALRDH